MSKYTELVSRMVYCSGSTSHIKYETIVLLLFIALRDFGRSDAKVHRKKFTVYF